MDSLLNRYSKKPLNNKFGGRTILGEYLLIPNLGPIHYIPLYEIPSLEVLEFPKIEGFVRVIVAVYTINRGPFADEKGNEAWEYKYQGIEVNP